MPFESKAQMRFMYSQHPTIAKRWQKETKNAKSLPNKKKHSSGNYSDGALNAAKRQRGMQSEPRSV